MFLIWFFIIWLTISIGTVAHRGLGVLIAVGWIIVTWKLVTVTWLLWLQMFIILFSFGFAFYAVIRRDRQALENELESEQTE